MECHWWVFLPLFTLGFWSKNSWLWALLEVAHFRWQLVYHGRPSSMGFRLVQILVLAVVTVLVFLSPNFQPTCVFVCHFPSLLKSCPAVWMSSPLPFSGGTLKCFDVFSPWYCWLNSCTTWDVKKTIWPKCFSWLSTVRQIVCHSEAFSGLWRGE